MATQIKGNNINLFSQTESSSMYCLYPAFSRKCTEISCLWHHYLNCTQNQALFLLYAVLQPILPTVKFYFPVKAVIIPFPAL